MNNRFHGNIGRMEYRYKVQETQLYTTVKHVAVDTEKFFKL